MTGSREDGFTLIEALLAMMIVALIVISFLGVRTHALIDATQARNWRLAREIAEEKMSELRAGALEVAPQSGNTISLAEKYEEGWSYKVVIGESAVADLEGELANEAGADDSGRTERLEWQRNREDYRRANQKGLSYSEYQDQRAEEDYRQRMEEKAPSETDFEEVAVVVYFPKLNPDYEGQKDYLVVKAKLSTLALSGLTPEQAEAVAQAKGESTGEGNPAGGAPALPGSGEGRQ